MFIFDPLPLCRPVLAQFNLCNIKEVYTFGLIHCKEQLPLKMFMLLLSLLTAAVLSSRLAEAQSSRGTVPAFLPHLWPSRQPAVMCEWRCCHDPQHSSVEWQRKGTRDRETRAILNTGTSMLSRDWQCQHTHDYLWTIALRLGMLPHTSLLLSCENTVTSKLKWFLCFRFRLDHSKPDEFQSAIYVWNRHASTLVFSGTCPSTLK